MSRSGAATIGERRWMAMTGLVALEFIVGLAALVEVPFGRTSWLPSTARVLFAAHALLGAVLLGAAVWVLVSALPEGRIRRASAFVGFAGIALGGAGGMLSLFHASRLAGTVVMLLGTVLAGFAYLTPALAGPQGEAG